MLTRAPATSNGTRAKSPATHPATKKATITRLPFSAFHIDSGFSGSDAGQAGAGVGSHAVGSGFGYYSLSSIFIADFRGAELGTVALLCNVMREIFTLLAAPLVARWCGPLAAVSIGGAPTFDTTLPVITQAAGKPYAVVSIFHGCTLDFSVPFLVTFFCTL